MIYKVKRSTLPERIEKSCLNCGATMLGRYCQDCGQENVKHGVSFFGMFKHFVFDLLHFDGKFFRTLKYLFLKPGFVPRSYNEGKRVFFLEPFKMYLFTSTILFLVTGYLAAYHVNTYEGDFYKKNKGGVNINIVKIEKEDTLNKDASDWPLRFKTYKEFKDTITKRRGKENVNWFENLMLSQFYKYVHLRQVKIENANTQLKKDMVALLPKFLFFLLPVFTWIIQALYFRKRYYFSDHGIFTLYLFVTIFIVIMLSAIIKTIIEQSTQIPFSDFEVIPTLIIFFYIPIALKKFYQQGWIKTIFKYLLFLFFGSFIMAIAMTVFIFLVFLAF